MTPLWTVKVQNKETVEGVDWTNTFDELQAELDETKGNKADRIEVDGNISHTEPGEVIFSLEIRGYCYTRNDTIQKKLCQDIEEIRDWIELEVHFYMLNKLLDPVSFGPKK